MLFGSESEFALPNQDLQVKNWRLGSSWLVVPADVSQDVKAGRSQALANIAHEQVRHFDMRLILLVTMRINDDCWLPSFAAGIHHNVECAPQQLSTSASHLLMLTANSVQVTEEYKRMTAAMEDPSKRGDVYVQPWKQRIA